MSDRERQVRDEAYRLWNEAGRPEGEGEAYWYEAEKLVVGGKSAPTNGKAAKAKPAKAVAKPAVKSAGASGVAVAVANDVPKPRLKKGAALDVEPAKSGPAKPSKAKAAPASAAARRSKVAKPKAKS